MSYTVEGDRWRSALRIRKYKKLSEINIWDVEKVGMDFMCFNEYDS